MLWLTWHMWILLLLAFAGGMIAGWVLHSKSDTIPAEPTEPAPQPTSVEPEPAASPEPALIETSPEPSPKAEDAEGEPQDLTKINGLGPKAAERLNELGVVRYAQIASWSEADIERFDGLTNARGRIERSNWVEQAKILASR